MGIFKTLFGGILGLDKKKQDEIEKQATELDSKIKYFDPENPTDGDRIVIRNAEWGTKYVKQDDGSFVKSDNYSRHELVLKSDVTAYELLVWWTYRWFDRENWVGVLDRWGFIIYPDHSKARFLENDELVNKIPWMNFFIKKTTI